MYDLEEKSIEKIHGWKENQWECGVNLLQVTARDLYPQERNCCTWTKHSTLAAQGAVNWKENPVDFCGIVISKGGETSDGVDPQDQTCCELINPTGEHMPGIDCDFKYFSGGVAWLDYIDFLGNEKLWLKYYTKAWHIATENGQDEESMKYLVEDGEMTRNHQSEEEQ